MSHKTIDEFREEAERTMKHLTPEGRDEWARHVHKHHPGLRKGEREVRAVPDDTPGQYVPAAMRSIAPRGVHIKFPLWFKVWAAAIYLILLLIAFLLLSAGRAKAQGTSQIDVITFTDSTGTVIKSYASPFRFKCGTNVTCSASGATMTVTASATGATAWSGITAATNANSGTFTATGNSWDFSAAAAFTLPATSVSGLLSLASSGIHFNDATTLTTAPPTTAVIEQPAGTLDGANVTFTLAHTPVSGTIKLDLNGLILRSGAGNDFTVSGSTITMSYAPQATDTFTSWYEY
jgi:hypothetical protein